MPPSAPSRGCGSFVCCSPRTQTAWSSATSRRKPAIANSTLSHHLEKLKIDELVTVTREKVFIRYRANTDALEELLGFLYAECCTRNNAVEPKKIAAICK